MALRSARNEAMIQAMRYCRLSCVFQHVLTPSISVSQSVSTSGSTEPLSSIFRRQGLRWGLLHMMTGNVRSSGSFSESSTIGRGCSVSSSAPVETKLEFSKFESLSQEDLDRAFNVSVVEGKDGIAYSWYQTRQCSTRTSGYRSSIVQKSTRNVPLAPKKWKRTLPSKEVLNAVQSLRRAKGNSDRVKEVIRKNVSRLLKLELMLVLSELQRLDECALAQKIFDVVRKESWYRPDLYLYQTMVQMFGKNKLIKEAERMFVDLEKEGLEPDDSIKRELLRSYVTCEMIPEAIKLYKELVKVERDQGARSILFKGLSAEDKLELSEYEKGLGYDWS